MGHKSLYFQKDSNLTFEKKEMKMKLLRSIFFIVVLGHVVNVADSDPYL